MIIGFEFCIFFTSTRQMLVRKVLVYNFPFQKGSLKCVLL